MIEVILSVLATVGGVMMSLAHIPQAYKIYKTKSAHDISLLTYSIFLGGSIIWIVYGAYFRDWPVLISFVVSLVAILSVFVLLFRYK
ncbi:SemiSWEET family sugar transporter [Thermoproteota archaeon]